MIVGLHARDDGRGADVLTAGNGLRGMRERLASLWWQRGDRDRGRQRLRPAHRVAAQRRHVLSPEQCASPADAGAVASVQ